MLGAADIHRVDIGDEGQLSSVRIGADQQFDRRLESEGSTADEILAQCRACARAGRWAEAEATALQGAAAYPEEPSFHAQLVWATYRQDRTVEAYELVTKAARRFPRSVAIAYAAACLNGALHRISEARHWLNLAIDRASNPDKVKLRSLVQPELLCVWNEGNASRQDE